MSIRDHYIPVFNSIARVHDERPSTAQIGRDDSLPKVLGYTRQYVVEQTTRHFRYDYYRDALSHALVRLNFEPADRRVVHWDIGCGPGVFSWVMYDYMAAQDTLDPAQVDYYGYDRCAAMIAAASLFLERFPDRYEFHGFSDLTEILTTLAGNDLTNCDVVVTFGYALVQVRDNPTALDNFATLISCLFPSHSCIMVAADAHNDRPTRDTFDDQCRAFSTALNAVGVTLENRLSTAQGSVMSARLTTE